jgi:hypothetical protein
MIDDHDLDLPGLADRKHEFSDEAQQAVLVREYETADLSGEDFIKKLLNLFF